MTLSRKERNRKVNLVMGIGIGISIALGKILDENFDFFPFHDLVRSVIFASVGGPVGWYVGSRMFPKPDESRKISEEFE